MTESPPPEIADPLDDDLDELMVSALEDCTGVLRAPTSKSARASSCEQPELVNGFDREAGKTWIYPTNKEFREYQFSIVRKTLLQNTLVCLPTGLGKTFIAAVLMYNYYRWFPRAKGEQLMTCIVSSYLQKQYTVIFMAPTKPLVAQQMQACFEVMGIPQAHMSEMTGSMSPSVREVAWREKRVFFLTPQIISNDISREICPARLICCVVVDEAHKALGNHAYVQVIQDLSNYNGGRFRVLALSATPGSGYNQIRQIIQNLLVANIEIRSENSPDILPYTHTRVVEKVVVPLNDELQESRTNLINVISVYVTRLHQRGCLCRCNPEQLSKYILLKEREKFRQNPPGALSRVQFGMVEGDFAISMSLFHALDLLQFYGLQSFHVYCQELLHGDKGQPTTRYELQHNVTFCMLMDRIKRKFGGNTLNSTTTSTSLNSSFKFVGYSHPKFKKLEEIVLAHFAHIKSKEGESCIETRIIIFAQYRETVREIDAVLSRHRPQVRPVILLGQGQGSAGSGAQQGGGLKQKVQLEVMSKFRSGECNVLVSTCIGEEGLDIGDVDLIICFDAQKSPVRLIQRMGRTGRRRNGRVVILMTKGKEENTHNQGQYNSKAVNRGMVSSFASYELYSDNPRMIPGDLEPVCHKMYLKCGTFVHEKTGKKAVMSAAKAQKLSEQHEERLHHKEDDMASHPNLKDMLLSGEQRSRRSCSVNVGKKDCLGSKISGHRLVEKMWAKQKATLAVSSDDDDFVKVPLPSKSQSEQSLPSVNIRDELDDFSVESAPSNSLSDEDLCGFFKVLNKRTDSEECSSSAKYVNNGASHNCIRPFIKTPPLPCSFQMLDEIGADFVSFISDEANACSKPLSNNSFLFKTPNLVKSSPAATSTLRTPVAADPKDVTNESLYSMTQLLSIIDHNSVDLTSPGLLCCDLTRKSLPKGIMGGNTQKNFESPWDSDDDFLSNFDMIPLSTNKPHTDETLSKSNCDIDFAEIIPPSPKKSPTTAARFFSKSTVQRSNRNVSTSTPLVQTNTEVQVNEQKTTTILSPGSSSSSDRILNSRKRVPKKLPRRRLLKLESCDSDSKAIKPLASKAFLDDEAIVDSCSEYISSDEASEQWSSYDESFINDAMTQGDGSTASMYLHSVKSPRCRPGAFKLFSAANNGKRREHGTVFSQPKSSPESEYEEDSFCVGSNEDESPSVLKPPKRRRIVIASQSTSSEEIELTSPLNSAASPNEKPAVSSHVPTLLVSKTSPPHAQSPEVIILVNSQKIASSQNVISELRLKHKARVIIAQLGFCDYVLSCRVAVEYKSSSDLANGTQRNKLLERVKEMSANFQRWVLVVETANSDAKRLALTKQVANILVCLVDAGRVIFTNSKEHTAKVLYDLACTETKAGHAVNFTTDPKNSARFSFYRKLAANNYVAALTLWNAFSIPNSLFQCTPKEIAYRCKWPLEKATTLHQNILRVFNTRPN